MEWQPLSSDLLIASQSTPGNIERRHQDWLDDNATDIRSLIHDKNDAHDALLHYPNSRTLHKRLSSIRATVQRGDNDPEPSRGVPRGDAAFGRKSSNPAQHTQLALWEAHNPPF